MKIVDYRVTPIAFGDPPLRAASGMHVPWALRTILEVVSDDCVCGVSETHGGSAVVNDLLAVGDLVVGRDPFQLAELEHVLLAGRIGAIASAAGPALWEGRLSSPPRTFGAIEVACLICSAKRSNARSAICSAGACATGYRTAPTCFTNTAAPAAHLASRSIRRPPAGTLPGSARRSTHRHLWSKHRRWSKPSASARSSSRRACCRRTRKFARSSCCAKRSGRMSRCASTRTPPGRSKPACATHPSSKDYSSTTKTPSPARKIWQPSRAPALSRWLPTCVA
jgi:hypothetical protein